MRFRKDRRMGKFDHDVHTLQLLASGVISKRTAQERMGIQADVEEARIAVEQTQDLRRLAAQARAKTGVFVRPEEIG